MKLAVIGGGIAGLSAAWELAGHIGDRANGDRANGDRASVTVYEPGPSVGSCGRRSCSGGRWTRAPTRC